MLGAVGNDEGEGEKVPPPGLALPLPLDGAVADIVLHCVPPAGDCVRTPLSEAPLIDAQALPLRGAEAGADKEKEGVPLSDGAAEPVAMALPLLAPLGGALAESVPLAPPLDEGDAEYPRESEAGMERLPDCEGGGVGEPGAPGEGEPLAVTLRLPPPGDREGVPVAGGEGEALSLAVAVPPPLAVGAPTEGE